VYTLTFAAYRTDAPRPSPVDRRRRVGAAPGSPVAPMLLPRAAVRLEQRPIVAQARRRQACCPGHHG
jgi:hypothetical protein